MLSFASDYINGAHPEILKRLCETNGESLTGYGLDDYSLSAAEKIKTACDCSEAEVYFLTGGTQTNQVVISTMLKPYEGVIAANTGHVSLHEAGAIEYTGHKVIELPQREGKLSAKTVDDFVTTYYADENHTHMTFPGMVYISYPTEYGTLYSKQELTDLADVCHKHKLTLYIDGARLGYGLASPACDLTLSEIANLCDVFYIGGTKVGALCGEAVVFTKNNMPARFETMVKQRGAMLAKGRLLGIQFDTLFTDDLYMKISQHAMDLAIQLKTIFTEKGYTLHIDSPTNQQFIILENTQMKKLLEKVDFRFWETYDADHTVVRFATSWSTTQNDLEKLKTLL